MKWKEFWTRECITSVFVTALEPYVEEIQFFKKPPNPGNFSMKAGEKENNFITE